MGGHSCGGRAPQSWSHAHLLTPLEEMEASGGGSDPQHRAEPDESSGFLCYGLGSCALLNPSIPSPNSSPEPPQAGTLGFHGWLSQSSPPVPGLHSSGSPRQSTGKQANTLITTNGKKAMEETIAQWKNLPWIALHRDIGEDFSEGLTIHLRIFVIEWQWIHRWNNRTRKS